MTTLTIEKLVQAMETIQKVPPMPFFASHSMFPVKSAYKFEDDGREYVGAHPSFWAMVPACVSIAGPLYSIPVLDLDAEYNGEMRAQFFSAMRRAMLRPKCDCKPKIAGLAHHEPGCPQAIN